MQRGRSSARGGQVLSIDIDKGEVKAKVQGSMPKPYAITIQLKVLSDKDWARVIKGLSGQALFVAKLLAGEMPQEIETVFKDADLSLFPRRSGDLKTSCSCPDSSNPCKHIAAVYYLLAEEFDRDPFLLVRLRGLSREEFFGHLNKVAQPKETAPSAAEERQAPSPGEPLPVDPVTFWSVGKLPDDLFGDVQPAPVSAALAKWLGASHSGAAQSDSWMRRSRCTETLRARGWRLSWGSGRLDSIFRVTGKNGGAGGVSPLIGTAHRGAYAPARSARSEP